MFLQCFVDEHDHLSWLTGTWLAHLYGLRAVVVFSQYWSASKKTTIDLIRVAWWFIKEESCLPSVPQTGQRTVTEILLNCWRVTQSISTRHLTSRYQDILEVIHPLSNPKKGHMCRTVLLNESKKSITFYEICKGLERELVVCQWNMLLMYTHDNSLSFGTVFCCFQTLF